MAWGPRLGNNRGAVKLVVAEKPSMGRDIAKVLGARRAGQGQQSGNGWVVTWCVGHLIELEDPATYDDRWKRWALDTLPMVPDRFQLRPTKSQSQQWRVVRDLLRSKDFECVVNACDAGREGELIFRFVYEKAGARLPVRRLWISSLTDEAIGAGFANLAPSARYDDLAHAARCRAEADWLVGLNATRAMTLVERNRGFDDGVWSIGRVQTPTLALIVERERAIQCFEPRDFWTLNADVGQGGAVDAFRAQWHDPSAATRLGTEALAEALQSRVQSAMAAQGEGLVVDRVDDNVHTDRAPQLFDLTSLQRRANRRFGFSADRTLGLAQTLYERHKLITYPRTDARVLTKDQRKTIEPRLRSLTDRPGLGEHAQRVLDDGPRITKRVIDDAKVSDHHAIVPTGKSAARLSGDEAKIFDLIATRFVAALSPDAKVAVTKVVLRAGEGKVRLAARPEPAARERILDAFGQPPDAFVAKGRVILEPGWQLVEPPPASKDQQLPKLSVGAVMQASLHTDRGRTRPPPRHSEASLLSSMEYAGKDIEEDALRHALKDRGLGTPATRASIIETLIRRAYIVRTGKVLAPTDKGIAVIERLPVPTLRSPELTGSWEARLAAIARGQATRADFMGDVARFVAEVVGAIAAARATAPTPTLLVGASAGSAADKRGRSSRRSGSGRSARPPSVRQPRPLAPPEDPPAAGDARRSDGQGRAPAQPGPVGPDGKKAFEPGFGALAVLTCPKCAGQGMVAGKRAWGCARWRSGCDLIIPFEVEGRPVTNAQLRDLLARGKTRPFVLNKKKARLVLDGVVRLETD